MLALLSSCKQMSNTHTWKLQVAVLPDVSVAVQVTVVQPRGKQLPDGGLQAVVTPGQLSLAVGGGKLTTAQVWPGSGVTAVTLPGQVITGGCVSVTVTVNVHGEPGAPDAVHVTVVVPFEKNEPDAGEQVIVPQPLPTGVGAG